MCCLADGVVRLCLGVRLQGETFSFFGDVCVLLTAGSLDGGTSSRIFRLARRRHPIEVQPCLSPSNNKPAEAG